MIIVPGCRLLVKPLTLEETDEKVKSAKAQGILLLEVDERKQKVNIDKGILLQIGPKASEDYIGGVKVGDTIGFAKFGGKFITDPETNEELLVINDEDLIVILKENKV
jgi:co-chaperonin GroES (HSP10)